MQPTTTEQSARYIPTEEFPKPNVLVSKYLEFNAVRYNGNKLSSQVGRTMRKSGLFTFFPICPEVQIGLGVPR